VGGGEVGFAARVVVGVPGEQVLGVGEVDLRDVLGHVRQPRVEQVDRGGGAVGDGGDHARDGVAQHGHDVAVVAHEAEFGVEAGVLREVAGGVVRFGPEHRAHLVDAFEHPDHRLLEHLR
jgi:hypothetical protein